MHGTRTCSLTKRVPVLAPGKRYPETGNRKICGRKSVRITNSRLAFPDTSSLGQVPVLCGRNPRVLGHLSSHELYRMLDVIWCACWLWDGFERLVVVVDWCVGRLGEEEGRGRFSLSPALRSCPQRRYAQLRGRVLLCWVGGLCCALGGGWVGVPVWWWECGLTDCGYDDNIIID